MKNIFYILCVFGFIVSCNKDNQSASQNAKGTVGAEVTKKGFTGQQLSPPVGVQQYKSTNQQCGGFDDYREEACTCQGKIASCGLSTLSPPPNSTPVTKRYNCPPNALEGGGNKIFVTSFLDALGTNQPPSGSLVGILQLSITPPTPQYLACVEVINNNDQVVLTQHIDNSPRGIAACQHLISSESKGCTLEQ